MILESSTGGAASGMLDNGKGSVNEGIGFILSGGTGTRLSEKDAEDLGNSQVDALTDGVSLVVNCKDKR